MEKGNKILLFGFIVIGFFMQFIGHAIGGAAYTGEAGVIVANILIFTSYLMIGVSITGLVVAYLRLRNHYKISALLILVGIVLVAIPITSTYSFYGYNYDFTTFPFSFIGYPLVGFGIAIIIYSYFTSHLGVEVIQRKEEHSTISTAKLVWKENNDNQQASTKAKDKEDINAQLMKQHTLLNEVESEETKEQHIASFYCRYCGAQNKSDATYCEKCGKNIR